MFVPLAFGCAAQTHTAQHWADTFITELNDTHIEADLRMRHTPPPVSFADVVSSYMVSGKRLLVLGYNATLTTNIEAPRLPKRQFEQVCVGEAGGGREWARALQPPLA